jgi:hypothetical protein
MLLTWSSRSALPMPTTLRSRLSCTILLQLLEVGSTRPVCRRRTLRGCIILSREFLVEDICWGVVLRRVCRTLLPDGRVMITGSNPNGDVETRPYATEYRVEYISPVSPYISCS